MSRSSEQKILEDAVCFLLKNAKITTSPPMLRERKTPTNPGIVFAHIVGRDSLIRWVDTKGDLDFSVWWGYESSRQPFLRRERFGAHPHNPRNVWNIFLGAIIHGKYLRTDTDKPYVIRNGTSYFAAGAQKALRLELEK